MDTGKVRKPKRFSHKHKCQNDLKRGRTGYKAKGLQPVPKIEGAFHGQVEEAARNRGRFR